MRLAFAVATAVLPDIVILDEALAVGDARFQKKCVDRIHDLRTQGKTIFFCSHALYYVSTLCDRALWLRDGRGRRRRATPRRSSSSTRSTSRGRTRRRSIRGPGPGQTRSAGSPRSASSDGEDREAAVFRPGDPWTLELAFQGDTPERPLHVHVAVVTPDQVTCFVADSKVAGDRTVRRPSAAHGPLSRSTPFPSRRGSSSLVAFLGDEKGLALYDARSDVRFRVESDHWTSGFMVVPSTFTEVG